MSDPTHSINLEFLPDWARESSAKIPSFSDRSQREERGPRGDRPPRGRKDSGDRRDRPPQKFARGKGGPRERREPPPQETIPVRIQFLPEPAALKSVADQIHATGKAYPLFSLAKMFLEKPERYLIKLSPLPAPKGRGRSAAKESEASRHSSGDRATADIYQCNTCQAVSLDQVNMVFHVIQKHSDKFYKKEQTQAEPPKGNFTSVARCNLNGALIGPSNHHAYQTNLLQLYRKEFRNMSFERFKESISLVHDPEVVKKWQESLSSKTTYLPLNAPEGTAPLNESDVERHFRENHLAAEVIKATECTFSGSLIQSLDDSKLFRAIRTAWEAENRFPIGLAMQLRPEFFKANLHVFHGKKDVQFVTLTRPKALVADANSVSKNIFAILEFLKANPGSDRKKVLEAIGSPLVEGVENPAMQDIHWLVRQGHIIEHHNGRIEAVEAPPPKPKPAEAKAEESKVEEAKSETSKSTPTSVENS